MTESRQELVNWVNDLLLLDVSKVEQCGSGAVYCQIFDSIFLDVPMSKVRFDVNSEYQYLNNFKILQNAFTKHRLDRDIPVERLVKCRFQDNLEFLQWMRRFWDANFPGHEYDAAARRKGPSGPKRIVSNGSTATAGASAGSTASGGSSRAAVSRTPLTTAARPAPAPVRSAAPAPRPAARPAARVVSGSASAGAAVKPLKDKIATLEAEHEELVSTVDILEAERNFYYDKLYNVEQLIQVAVDTLDKKQDEDKPEGEDAEPEEPIDYEDTYTRLVREIQTVLYQTADGFEIPSQEYETEETF